jgi:hypothetical protein
MVIPLENGARGRRKQSVGGCHRNGKSKNAKLLKPDETNRIVIDER